MNNSQLLTLFSGVFLLLGGYNLFVAIRRFRDAQTRGTTIKWYKQLNLLTGLEYLLLAIVFLLSLGIRNNTLSPALKNIAVPIYLVTLLAAAVLAGLVIRQGIMNARELRAQSKAGASNGARPASISEEKAMDRQERALQVERRRERRKNAAAARRRHAGRA